MAPVGSHLRRGIAAAVGALVLGNLAPIAVDGAEAPSDGASPVVFFTPVDGGATASAVHLMLGADPGVVSVQLEYSADGGTRWQTIGGRLVRRAGSTVFETTWNSTLKGQSVRVRATGYDSKGIAVGSAVEETVTLSASATRYTFTTPGRNAASVGVFKRTDGRWFAAVSGTTTGILAPTVDAPPPVATTTPTTTPTSSTTLPGPRGIFDSATHAFTAPVDLSAYAGRSPAPTALPVRANDGTSSDAVDAPIYTQVVTAVRSTTTTLPGTGKVTVTARVTDQYGQPVPGAPVRLSGYASGATRPVAQLAVTDVLGTVTFTGPGLGTGPVVAAGYPTGFYIAYADLNVDGRRGAKEPGYESVVGTVSFAAPGKAFYHDNRRTAGAGGVLADSLQGTRAAAAKGYKWIDQDGQLSYTSRAGLRRGAARVSSSAQLTWVNAHGAPFNPRWMRKGRFETRSWAAIKRFRGLRNAQLTFKQNAAYGISVEWEVKDIRPFTRQAALDAAFTNLAAAAQRFYGPAWRTRVQVKMLSNLAGGPAFALKVLKVAHAHGFTTIYLARGTATRVQMPASAHGYVTYVRGAGSGVYAPIPPASQERPVVVTGPPAVATR
jgi:hypothetical protein